MGKGLVARRDLAAGEVLSGDERLSLEDIE